MLILFKPNAKAFSERKKTPQNIFKLAADIAIYVLSDVPMIGTGYLFLI